MSLDRVAAFQSRCKQAIDGLLEELKTIKTGRATPALVEGLPVDVYGGSVKLKLMELAAITTEGVSTILISPFDVKVIPDIEKAILKSPLGVSPRTQGTNIQVDIPPLSQEQREKIIKLVGQIIEDKRVSIRVARDEARKHLKYDLDQKIISEDEKFRAEKKLDEIVKKTNEIIEDLRNKKEVELREV